MRFNKLKELSKKLYDACHDQRREYALTDEVSVLVEVVCGYDVDLSFGLFGANGQPLPASQQTPAIMAKLDEVRTTVAKWKSGDAADLPASTCERMLTGLKEVRAQHERHLDRQPR